MRESTEGWHGLQPIQPPYYTNVIADTTYAFDATSTASIIEAKINEELPAGITIRCPWVSLVAVEAVGSAVVAMEAVGSAAFFSLILCTACFYISIEPVSKICDAVAPELVHLSGQLV